VELRQIQYFLQVARAGTFSRAADELYVAKSVLSKQIKLLEEELGAQLVLRGNGRREAELTAAGEAFLPEAVTIVEAMEHGRQAVQELAGDAKGHAKVVITQGWDSWPGWDAILNGFRERHPEMATSIAQKTSIEELLAAVSAGEADLAVAGEVEVPVTPGLRIEVLHSEPLVVGLPPGHPLGGRSQVTLSELREERWLLQPIERALMTRAAAERGMTLRVDSTVPTPTMLLSLLHSGAGVTVFGRSEAAFYEPATAAELVEPELTASIFIAYREAYTTAAARAVRDYLRESFGVGGNKID